MTHLEIRDLWLQKEVQDGGVKGPGGGESSRFHNQNLRSKRYQKYTKQNEHKYGRICARGA
eukprot:45525-Karenia_brevis.AAC.1